MSRDAAISDTIMQQYRAASRKLSQPAGNSTVADEEIHLSYGNEEDANPIASAMSGVRGGANMYGANSVQIFATGDATLSHTHEDADGWADYVSRFAPLNFRFKDASVSTWEYLDPWDDWQDTYGLDAVRAFYHSGHGGMDGNGVFFAPLGAAYSTYGAYGRSDQMNFANQHARYLFLSTCFSCRVLEGHNPIRTWNRGNNGLRMLFGYETTSVDAGNYGSAFWNHWNRQKSLSQAWLDASWYDISTHQAPSAFACGSSSADASNRLYNERQFFADAVSKSWYQWRWYYAAASAMGQREANRRLPRWLALAHLEPRTASSARIRELFNTLPLSISIPREMTARPSGAFVAGELHNSIAIAPDGAFEAVFAQANRSNRTAIGIQAGISAASAFIRQSGFDRQGVQFDRVLHNWENGGSPEGSGTLETPRVTETLIQFTQVINGLPVVTPGQGKVIVRVDNDGRILGVADTTRPVAGLADQITAPPPLPGKMESISVSNGLDPEAALAKAWEQRMKTFIVKGSVPRAFATVPGSSEVGYSFRNNAAIVVARQEVEVDFGNGLLKRYTMEVPIAE
jgi:Family of unknown function (DUF6345)